MSILKLKGAEGNFYRQNSRDTYFYTCHKIFIHIVFIFMRNLLILMWKKDRFILPICKKGLQLPSVYPIGNQHF